MNINIVLLMLFSNTSNINNMAKKDFKNSINQTNIPAKSGIQGLFSTTDDLGNSDDSSISLKAKEVTLVTAITSVILSDLDLKDVRQTFIIRNDYLERLKDYVHHKRQAGYSFYTQKEALQEALEAFFSSLDVPTRPDFIKEAEQKRANRIKKSL